MKLLKVSGPLAILLIVAALIVTLVACDDSDQHKAARAAAGIASGLKVVQAENEALYASGLVDKAEAVAIAQYVVDATRVNDQYIVQLRSLQAQKESNAAVYVGLAAGVVKSLDALHGDGVLHVKNPEARARLDLAFAAMEGSIEVLKALMRPAPAGAHYLLPFPRDQDARAA